MPVGAFLPTTTAAPSRGRNVLAQNPRSQPHIRSSHHPTGLAAQTMNDAVAPSTGGGVSDLNQQRQLSWPATEQTPTGTDPAQHETPGANGTSAAAAAAAAAAATTRSSIAVACVSCLSRHLKCDGATRCSRCISENVNCVYLKSRRGWKGPRRTAKATIKQNGVQVAAPGKPCFFVSSRIYPLLPEGVFAFAWDTYMFSLSHSHVTARVRSG